MSDALAAFKMSLDDIMDAKDEICAVYGDNMPPYNVIQFTVHSLMRFCDNLMIGFQRYEVDGCTGGEEITRAVLMEHFVRVDTAMQILGRAMGVTDEEMGATTLKEIDRITVEGECVRCPR